MSFALDSYLTEQRRRIEAALERWLPPLPAPSDDPGRLCEAMRYAVLGGGKRLRPIVTLGAFAACGGGEPPPEPALRAASAVELVHCYSLVHDDLPAMDDDEMRRGRPTVHRAFGEATAILVGDALLTLAFGWAAEAGAPAVARLARHAGHDGMIAGQARDLALGGATPALAALERLHAEKTGALFAAAAALGALVAGADAERTAALEGYGLALGVAFQHADDLADGDHDALAEAARARAGALLEEARARLSPFGGAAAPLGALAEAIGRRGGAPAGRS